MLLKRRNSLLQEFIFLSGARRNVPHSIELLAPHEIHLAQKTLGLTL